MSSRSSGGAHDDADPWSQAKRVLRFGWRITLLPAAPLPRAVRAAAFGAARAAVDAAYCLPLAPRDWLDELADELDGLETETARREDLGSRLRREARRRQRGLAEAP